MISDTSSIEFPNIFNLRRCFKPCKPLNVFRLLKLRFNVTRSGKIELKLAGRDVNCIAEILRFVIVENIPPLDKSICSKSILLPVKHASCKCDELLKLF